MIARRRLPVHAAQVLLIVELSRDIAFNLAKFHGNGSHAVAHVDGGCRSWNNRRISRLHAERSIVLQGSDGGVPGICGLQGCEPVGGRRQGAFRRGNRSAIASVIPVSAAEKPDLILDDGAAKAASVLVVYAARNRPAACSPSLPGRLLRRKSRAGDSSGHSAGN